MENIVGIKEASGDIAQVAEMAALTRGKLDIYSGNDNQIVPLLSLGGKGVISVLSNVAPRFTHDMVAKYLNGDIKESCDMQLDACLLYTSSVVLMVCLVFFAFTTILGWNYYGERCIEYLFNRNRKVVRGYRWLYILAIFIGPYMTVQAVWNLSLIHILNRNHEFPRAKAERNGYGIGLCYEIVKLHGWKMDYASSEEKGTTVKIRI